MSKELEFGDIRTDSMKFDSSGQDVCVVISNGSTEAVCVYILRPSDIRDTVDYLNGHLREIRASKVGIIDTARWWFKHYPSDVFVTGEIAEIRRQFACIIIRRHKNRTDGGN